MLGLSKPSVARNNAS